MDQLDELLNERIHLVAVGLASNLVGTVNPVRVIAERSHRFEANVFVDAQALGRIFWFVVSISFLAHTKESFCSFWVSIDLRRRGNRLFAVEMAGAVRLGMNIRYDATFPEAARVLLLGGGGSDCATHELAA